MCERVRSWLLLSPVAIRDESAAPASEASGFSSIGAGHRTWCRTDPAAGVQNLDLWESRTHLF